MSTGGKTAAKGGASPSHGKHDLFMQNIRSCIPLWPCILGLTLSRVGVVVSSYGSYASTDAGIFTDGSSVFSVAVMAIVLLLVVARKPVFSRAFVRRLGAVSIGVEALSLFMLALTGFLGVRTNVVHLVLSTISMIAVSGAIYFWLRKARGSNTLTAAIMVFSAVFLSEVVVFPFTYIAVEAGYALAGMLVLGQFLCMRWSRGRMRDFTIGTPSSPTDYFEIAKTMSSNMRILVMTAVGIGCLSVVSGMLRGYPNGLPIEFTPFTRVLYSLLTLALCLAIIVLVARGSRRIMTTGLLIIMQLVAYLALLAYAIAPTELQFGAVFATVLNVLILGFNWYVTIAFMTYGWRDPLYYALGGWIVWFGGRVLGRVVLLQVYPINADDLIMNAFIAGVLLVSTQVTFMMFAGMLRKEQEEGQEESPQAAEKQSTMERLMGLDSSKSFTSLRQAAMEESAKEMGRQFLLSERETEVLVLYALGFTQKRVAEELCISSGTVHGHIKRIYMKTGLHSRQQILDYMEQYTA